MVMSKDSALYSEKTAERGVGVMGVTINVPIFGPMRLFGIDIDHIWKLFVIFDRNARSLFTYNGYYAEFGICGSQHYKTCR